MKLPLLNRQQRAEIDAAIRVLDAWGVDLVGMGFSKPAVVAQARHRMKKEPRKGRTYNGKHWTQCPLCQMRFPIGA